MDLLKEAVDEKEAKKDKKEAAKKEKKLLPPAPKSNPWKKVEKEVVVEKLMEPKVKE